MKAIHFIGILSLAVIMGGIPANASETVKVVADSLVIIAKRDTSGRKPVTRWPADLPPLDANRIKSSKVEAYAFLMSEQTLRAKLPEVFIRDSGPIWYRSDSWRLSFSVLPLDMSLDAHMARWARAHSQFDYARALPKTRQLVPDPVIQALLAGALRSQMDQDYVAAILRYDRLLEEKAYADLALAMMIRCHEDMLNAELMSAQGTPARGDLASEQDFFIPPNDIWLQIDTNWRYPYPT